MGGHDSGEVASAIAVETICRVAQEEEHSGSPQEPEDIEQLLEFSFQSANNAIKASATERGTDMGTTMVCFLQIDERHGYVANVGDSRAYLLREQCLHQVTRDHSLVQKMVERGRITREEARVHPHSNILLRTVGTEYDVEIDIFQWTLRKGTASCFVQTAYGAKWMTEIWRIFSIRTSIRGSLPASSYEPRTMAVVRITSHSCWSRSHRYAIRERYSSALADSSPTAYPMAWEH